MTRTRKLIRHEHGTEVTLTLVGDDAALIARGNGDIEAYAPSTEPRVPDSIALISVLAVRAVEIAENLFLSVLEVLAEAAARESQETSH